MIRPILAPRPLKRAHTSTDGTPLPKSPPPPSNPPPPHVKSERSPSPLFVEKRLITSGTKRFTPIPVDCLPSCTQYIQNRLEWAAKCVKELEALNLIPERRLFRSVLKRHPFFSLLINVQRRRLGHRLVRHRCLSGPLLIPPQEEPCSCLVRYPQA